MIAKVLLFIILWLYTETAIKVGNYAKNTGSENNKRIFN